MHPRHVSTIAFSLLATLQVVNVVLVPFTHLLYILSTKFAVVSLKRLAGLNSDESESLFCKLFWIMVPWRLWMSFSSVSYLSQSRSGSNQHSMYFQTTDYCHPDMWFSAFVWDCCLRREVFPCSCISQIRFMAKQTLFFFYYYYFNFIF